MGLKQTIFSLAKQQNSFKSSDVAHEIEEKISRQYITKILRELVSEGKLVKGGTTKQTVYALPENAPWISPKVSFTLENKDLEEDKILKQIEIGLPGLNNLSENIKSIFEYAFSEITNNAIEHSQSKSIFVSAKLNNKNISFEVLDEGIGVFSNVAKKRKLASELEAVQDILKGKTTTSPKLHSGEGIFFTSKAGDIFIIESHLLRLRVDNLLPDVFIEQLQRSVPGTTVKWEMSISSDKELSNIFSLYQSNPTSFKFDKTSVLVRLYTMETHYISRSQARRLLAGLEKFQEIILDFDKVETVGQGFSDEIFRVFKQFHPHIKIIYQNANQAIKFMIDHVSSQI